MATTPQVNMSAFELKEKVAQLEQALLNSHPQLPVLLRTIHTTLRNDPDNVTILSEEEVGVIVAGLKKQTMTEITTSTVKAASNTKKLKNITLDQL